MDGMLLNGRRVLPTFLDNDESVYDTRLVWKKLARAKTPWRVGNAN